MQHPHPIRFRPLGHLDVSAERVDPTVVRRAWRLVGPYRARLAVFVLAALIGAALALVPPLAFKEVIDRAIPAGDRRVLAALTLAAFMASVGAALLALVERYLSATIGEGLIRDLRLALFDHVQRMPLAFFTRTQTGALLTRLNDDVVGAQRALTGTFGNLVQNVLGIIMTLGVMVALSWRVTLLAVALLPAFMLPARWAGRRLRALTREGMRLNAGMNSLMTERFNVAGALLVKLFGRPRGEYERFAKDVNRIADVGVKTSLHYRGLYVSLGLVGALATVAVYYVGGGMVIGSGGGAESIGTLVALATYVTQIYGPLTQLSNTRVDLTTALVSFERVFEVLDLPSAVTERPSAIDPPRIRGAVSYQGVRFRYPAATGSTLESLEGPVSPHADAGSGWILDGVSFEVAPGEMVAVVGPSGAGKTTLALLLPRLFDATEGRVAIDGHDVRDWSFAAISRAVGVVTQDPHLFHDSVAVNLRYAKPDASDSELVAACRAARIHDVIAALPDGYSTIVGERGYRLSGGEKQRIAIARVLLKDPAVVVLDEATAHLDASSERLVQRALREVLKGRTSLVIAHRLSTVIDADTILVLDSGRIVERGTHTELLARGGLYAELAYTQLRVAEPTQLMDRATPDGLLESGTL